MPGTGFLFGYLGGGALPFAEVRPGASLILAFKILPLVLVISALSALLFHWGVLQRVTGAFAALLRRSLGIDGPLALAAAVHIFVGMIEAPLLVRPYLAGLQRGEMFAMMTCGMAGVAGTVMVIYGAILEPVVPNALGTIIVASVVSTPAALAVAALMVPFRPPARRAAAEMTRERRALSSLDALVRGTADGVGPLVGITTTLLVTVALVALVNQALGLLPGGWTLQSLLAIPFRPVMWLIGIPWEQSGRGGAADGDEDDPERVRGLSGAGRVAGRRAGSAFAGDHDVCAVRLRQFGQLGDLGGGACGDGAGAAGRGGAAWDAVGAVGHDRDVSERGGGGGVE